MCRLADKRETSLDPGKQQTPRVSTLATDALPQICEISIGTIAQFLVDPVRQADPQLRNTFAYTRVAVKALRQKLLDEKGWQDEQLPKERTLCNMLNRMGYKLHKVHKTKPEKKGLSQVC